MPDDDGARWMTYAQLAAALGVEVESAKRRAVRGRWPRRMGNDQRMRVAVPATVLPTIGETVPEAVPPTVPPPAPDPTLLLRLAVAEAEVKRLEETVAALKAGAAGSAETTGLLRQELAAARQEVEAARQRERRMAEDHRLALDALASRPGASLVAWFRDFVRVRGPGGRTP